jgi:hypothetical protein
MNSVFFGTKEKFAIEIAIDHNFTGPFLVGRFRYWLNGVDISVSSDELHLTDLLHSMVWTNRENGMRECCKLFNLPDDVLSNYLEVRSIESPELAAMTAEIGDIDVEVVVFNLVFHTLLKDDCWLFLLSCGEKAKLVKKLPNVDSYEIVVGSISEFEQAISDAYVFLDAAQTALVLSLGEKSDYVLCPVRLCGGTEPL